MADEHPSTPQPPHEDGDLGEKLKRTLLGGPRNVSDPSVFHSVSLIAFLAWVGLGADGLSSSAYGPEEAFKALGEHTFLGVGLAAATALTVFIISYGYSRIIEQFPFGGGGYVVATRLLGPGAGVVSGSALIIDYVLTINTSVAAGADAIFSFVPDGLHSWKLPMVFVAIGLLTLMNLRGVKESVTILTPVFLVFLVTHAVLIVGAVAGKLSALPQVVEQVQTGYQTGHAALGTAGLIALFFRAYSMGGGTYTGIEAVSNGLAIMREPKVQTGKKTMVLMAVSLALTAGGIILAYLLLQIHPQEGKTMNAVLAEGFAGSFTVGGVQVGKGFVLVTLVSEALLLFVAAQAGFIDGPRVMANMASDSWLPHRFAQLSDRLVTQNGVLLMGAASLLVLLYTRGDVTQLVVLYSINVFVTFSLSQLAMCRFWWRDRAQHADWKRHISVHVVGLALCVFILAVTVYEKFTDGGWVTLALTSVLVAVCFLIRNHYKQVQESLKRLDEILPSLPQAASAGPKALEPKAPTAVLLVGSYAGLGVHQLLTVLRLFPKYYQNFVFVSVGVIDSATFKNVEEVEVVRSRTEASLKEYVALAQRLGLAADYRLAVGTEAVDVGEQLCREVAQAYPRALFFAGKLVFQKEQWFQRVLHNETAYSLQRRLQFAGLNAMVLPVRVLESA
jgi:amino acid transporter